MNVLLSLFVASLLAQQAPVAAPPAGSAGAPAAQAAAPATYKIGPQDVLKITVLDEPEISQPYRVDSDGMISFPFLVRVRAAGSTISELQDRIRTGLAKDFIRNAQVRIEIESYKSQSVMVSGEVRQPGKVPMTGTMTVLEALAAAGSATSAASSELTIARKVPGKEDSDLIHVNWKDLNLGKGTDVTLQDQDLINVPRAQTFLIQGQIHNPGSLVLEPNMTVQQAIATAGGISERGSDRRIKVSRLVNGKLVTIDLKMSDLVKPNDVITVGQRIF